MSKRSELAEHMAEYVRDNNLDLVFGGDVSRTSDRRGYVVLFSRPRTLDGSITIYSEKFILIRFAGPAYGSDGLVFDSESNALKFMELAFVECDFEAALDVPTKPAKKGAK